jgi:hypothetical protein
VVLVEPPIPPALLDAPPAPMPELLAVDAPPPPPAPPTPVLELATVLVELPCPSVLEQAAIARLTMTPTFSTEAKPGDERRARVGRSRVIVMLSFLDAVCRRQVDWAYQGTSRRGGRRDCARLRATS